MYDYPNTIEEFYAVTDRMIAEFGDELPHSIKLGRQTIHDGVILDLKGTVIGGDNQKRSRAIVASVLDMLPGKTGKHEPSRDELREILRYYWPLKGDGKHHPVINEVRALLGLFGDDWGENLEPSDEIEELETPFRGRVLRPMAVAITDLTAPLLSLNPGDGRPDSMVAPHAPLQAFLRLSMLSARTIQPHGVNLDGVFGALHNLVWTNLGPFQPHDMRMVEEQCLRQKLPLAVSHIDRFPRMVDYVIPSGVRIADGNRVRLGGHLAEGTTVMHEGFCNFNAGTLGASMVEGRISAGVVVGDGSDIGGSGSIQGTLSGGGQEVIIIGKNCLLGANAGTGISLGDECIVEAGTYITAGTIVTMPDTTTRKARELSGVGGLLYRRHSLTGRVEAVARTGDDSWKGLNAQLHNN